jgi:hypothetical protein
MSSATFVIEAFANRLYVSPQIDMRSSGLTDPDPLYGPLPVPAAILDSV